VLAGAGLGDQPRLAHPLGQQRLAQHVVDLVRPGVVEVLALEQHPRAAGVRGEARSLGEHTGPADVAAVQLVELGHEGGVGLRRAEGGVQLVKCRDERLGHEAAAVGTEPANRVVTGGVVTAGFGCGEGDGRGAGHRAIVSGWPARRRQCLPG
jgi:hypothetical protein